MLTYELGPPGGQATAWPGAMFTTKPVTSCPVLAVRNYNHDMHTIRVDGTPHIHVTTGQEEYKHNFLEPVPREEAQPTTTTAPDSYTDWKRPDHFAVGGLCRIDAANIETCYDEIRRQAEREIARLRQRRMDNHAEDVFTLLYNGGFLPTERVDDLIPQWSYVRIQTHMTKAHPTDGNKDN